MVERYKGFVLVEAKMGPHILLIGNELWPVGGAGGGGLDTSLPSRAQVASTIRAGGASYLTEDHQTMQLQTTTWEGNSTAVADIERFRRAAPRRVAPQPEQRTHLLVANPLDDDVISLLGIMTRQQWSVYWCSSCAEAMEMLNTTVVPVVISECTLPDGTWFGLLDEVSNLPQPPRFIVASRLADDSLWSEALNLCAYDVLVKPFDAQEVVRVVNSALSSWLRGREGGAGHAAAFRAGC
jgi:CheY-like chemotaxis protein